MACAVAASCRTGPLDPVRNHLHLIVQQHRGWSARELGEHLELLRQQAECADLYLISGLTASLRRALGGEPDRLGAGPHLAYMLGALALEPCDDPDVLALLLAGIRRRVDELRRAARLTRPCASPAQEGSAPTAEPVRPQTPPHTGSAPEPTPGTRPRRRQADGLPAPESATTSPSGHLPA